MKLELLKIIVPLLLSFYTILFVKPNIITLFSSSKSERLLLNKELRHLYNMFIFVSFFIFFPFAITHNTVKEKGSIYLLVEKYINYLFVIILAGFILSIIFNIRFKYYKSIRFKSYKSLKGKDRKKRRLKIEFILINSVLWFVFLSSSTIVYGIILNLAYIEKSSFYITFLIVYTPIYIFQLLPYLKTIQKLIYEEIKVKIVLTNGHVINNAFLLHPTYGNNILIGDKPDQNYCTHLITVPKGKIEYIEFFIKPKGYYDIRDYENNKIIISSNETKQQILKDVDDMRKELKI
jgi:hypothetical protein